MESRDFEKTKIYLSILVDFTKFEKFMCRLHKHGL